MSPEARLRWLRGSPWASWIDGVRVVVDEGEPLLVGLDRAVPWRGEPVDAQLRREGEGWTLRLGDGPGPDRLKQARGVLVLAQLADLDDTTLVRDAIWELECGPADGWMPLFGSGAPLGLDTVVLRLTDGAARVGATCGLAELVGAELVARAPQIPVRTLRALALDAVEHQRVASTLEWEGRVIRTTVRPLPLPRRACALHTLAP